VRGHADACLAAIGVECSAEGVGRHYGARRGGVGGVVDSGNGGIGGDGLNGVGAGGGILDAFLVAEEDTAEVPGVTVVSRPLLMSGPDATAAMVAACAEVAGVRI